MFWMRVVRKKPWPTRTQWRNALLVGALMLGGGMGGAAYAEQSVESGLVVAFIAVVPIMITALNAIWKAKEYKSKERASTVTRLGQFSPGPTDPRHQSKNNGDH